jgi:hypothetical protein
MGHTSTAVKPFLPYNSPKPIRGSWESNPAREKAGKKLPARVLFTFYT